MICRLAMTPWHLVVALSVAMMLMPAMPLVSDHSAVAQEATSEGNRYYFYNPRLKNQRSPTIRRDLVRPSVSGNRRAPANPSGSLSGVHRSKIQTHERRVGQAIKRLERVPGARDARTNNRLRVLRRQQRRVSRGLSRARSR